MGWERKLESWEDLFVCACLCCDGAMKWKVWASLFFEIIKDPQTGLTTDNQNSSFLYAFPNVFLLYFLHAFLHIFNLLFYFMRPFINAFTSSLFTHEFLTLDYGEYQINYYIL